MKKSPVELKRDDLLDDGARVISVGKCDFRNLVPVFVELTNGVRNTRMFRLLDKVETN